MRGNMRDSDKKDLEMINLYKKELYPAGKAADRQEPFTWKDAAHAVAPALLYTALANVVYSLFFQALAGRQVSGLLLQAATSAVCLGITGWWISRKEKIRLWSGSRTVYRFPAFFCYVSGVVMWGIGWNQIIYLTRLKEASGGYQRVTAVFYGNSLFLEILALCILAPLVEELVYRGMVYSRFRKKGGRLLSITGSALVFGLLHFNLVQCIYAAAAGLLLAYIVEQTGSIATAAAAHGTMNLVSVIWTETDWLDVLNQTGLKLYLLTGGCLCLAVVFVLDGNRLTKKDVGKKDKLISY